MNQPFHDLEGHDSGEDQPAGGRHLHDQEGSQEQQTDLEAPDDDRGRDLRQERLRGVPEVQGMATEEPEEVREGRRDLAAKHRRKIKAALQKTIAFWKQIRLMFQDYCNEEGKFAWVEYFRRWNATLCSELAVHPSGTRETRAIADAMGLTHNQLLKVAEIYNPGCFQRQAEACGLHGGRAFDLELGTDLLKEEKRQEVRNYTQAERTGLVIISPPCRMYSALQNLERLSGQQ